MSNTVTASSRGIYNDGLDAAFDQKYFSAYSPATGLASGFQPQYPASKTFFLIEKFLFFSSPPSTTQLSTPWYQQRFKSRWVPARRKHRGRFVRGRLAMAWPM